MIRKKPLRIQRQHRKTWAVLTCGLLSLFHSNRFYGQLTQHCLRAKTRHDSKKWTFHLPTTKWGTNVGLLGSLPLVEREKRRSNFQKAWWPGERRCTDIIKPFLMPALYKVRQERVAPTEMWSEKHHQTYKAITFLHYDRNFQKFQLHYSSRPRSSRQRTFP